MNLFKEEIGNWQDWSNVSQSLFAFSALLISYSKRKPATRETRKPCHRQRMLFSNLVILL